MSDPSPGAQIELLQTIIDHSDDGIVVVNGCGLILGWNQR